MLRATEASRSIGSRRLVLARLVREHCRLDVLLNPLLAGLYRGLGEELADFLRARAKCLRGVSSGDNALLERCADEREHASREASERVHVEIPHICWMDGVAKRPREATRGHLREPVERGAVDTAFLQQTDPEGRIAHAEVALKVYHGRWVR